MNPRPATSTLSWRLAGAALLAACVHLGWELAHGGIQTHHFLRSAAMPGFHNAWGLLLLPALAWWAGRRIDQRLAAGARPAAVWVAAAAALLAGVALSFAFASGREDLASTVFLSMLAGAVLLPACRAECVLGLVLGMVFTFGPVIPTLIGAALGGVSALVHRAIKPALLHGLSALRRS